MTEACAVHCNCDLGLVIRYLGGEYMTKWRDTEGIVDAVKDLVSDSDLRYIRCILTSGCTAEFNCLLSGEVTTHRLIGTSIL